MGGSMSSTRCDNSPQSAIAKDEKFVNDAHIPTEAPPVMQRPLTFEEKIYEKVRFLFKFMMREF